MNTDSLLSLGWKKFFWKIHCMFNSRWVKFWVKFPFYFYLFNSYNILLNTFSWNWIKSITPLFSPSSLF